MLSAAVSSVWVEALRESISVRMKVSLVKWPTSSARSTIILGCSQCTSPYMLRGIRCTTTHTAVEWPQPMTKKQDASGIRRLHSEWWGGWRRTVSRGWKLAQDQLLARCVCTTVLCGHGFTWRRYGSVQLTWKPSVYDGGDASVGTAHLPPCWAPYPFHSCLACLSTPPPTHQVIQYQQRLPG